jgi:hypothetical protein
MVGILKWWEYNLDGDSSLGTSTLKAMKEIKR